MTSKLSLSQEETEDPADTQQPSAVIASSWYFSAVHQ